MKEKLKRMIPKPLLPAVKGLYHGGMDTWDRLSGKRDALTPPRSLWFVGGGDFRRSGERFKGFFIELGGLGPDDRVLDVGCGVGRMAVPLTSYLSEKGRYEGFDAVAEGISWCQKGITSRFPNFRFQVSDLYNKTYNPQGKHKASEYRFPYPDASFDFAILTSVFTHLLREDAEHYVAELSRVLAPQGRLFATFFLLNPESEGLIEDGASSRVLIHELDGCRVQDPDIPEDAVGYGEVAVRGLLARHGFRVEEPIRYGKWCGRKEFLSYQDIVVAARE